MFEETLKLKPKMDNAALGGMERKLHGRFKRVATKFGSGLKSSLGGFLKGTLIAGAVSAIAAIMNPIKEVEASIENMMNKADNIATRAKQFGVSAGKYYSLQQIAQANDLDAGTLDMMLNKFQSELGRSKTDPAGKLRNYANQEGDVIDLFLKFLQSTNSLSSEEQAYAYKEILGDRTASKGSEFLRADLMATIKKLGLSPEKSEMQARSISKIADYQGIEALLKTKRDADQMMELSGAFSRKMISLRDASERKKNKREVQRFFTYEDIKSLDNAIQDVKAGIELGTVAVVKAVKASTKGTKESNDAIKEVWKNNPMLGGF